MNGSAPMTPAPAVWFVGAGPGDPELLTVKAHRLIREADLLLYPGSLTPPAITALASPGTRLLDTAPLTLEATHAAILAAVQAGERVVRLQAGDPCLYGTVREQSRLLDEAGVPWAVCPGVTSATAAAAAAGVSATIPEITQSLILTRTPGRTPMPAGQELAAFAARRCAMAVYLSGERPEEVAAACRLGGLPDKTLVVVAHRLGWEGERVIRTTLADMAEVVRAEGLTRQTLFLILPGQDAAPTRSKLYDPAFAHGFRGNEEAPCTR
ncbi:precorrin-4 C(11)-methyltransferase [Megalodesulfovibrio paquesii]